MNNKNNELAQRLRNVAYILEQSENSQNTYVIQEINSVVSELYFKELTTLQGLETPTELTGIFPKSDEFATENYHEEDVDQKSIGLSTRHKANTPAVEPKEETWESIWTDWNENFHRVTFLTFLENNFNTPTRKI